MRRYVEAALAEQAAGIALPFATVERASGTVVGSTRFGSAAPEHAARGDRVDLDRAALAAHRA